MSTSKVLDYSYTWQIENFDEKKQPLESPIFKVEIMENTHWKLQLYPDGILDEYRGFLSISLKRMETEEKFKGARIMFTFSIIATDVSSNISQVYKRIFCPGTSETIARFISRENLFENRSVYLPQNTLTIQCYMVRKSHTEKIIAEKTEKSVSNIQSLSDDLLRMYLDSEMSDVQICVEDKLFHAHKTVLCARSPVFCAMFKNETKEKASGCVNIKDIDWETVNIMLKFMYTDSIEDINECQAEKLYSAADRYDILPLRQKCSSVLKSSLCDANVCYIYELGELFQDVDLKAAAEKYIFMYFNRILTSSEWENFMKLKPQLSSQIMHKLLLKHFDD